MALSQASAEAARPYEHITSVSHGVPVYSTAYAGATLYCLVAETMCVNNLPKVAFDSAAAVIEPAISIRKSNALTTALPSHNTTSSLLYYRCCSDTTADGGFNARGWKGVQSERVQRRRHG